MESKWYLKEVENISLEDTRFEKSVEDILVLVSTIFNCKFAYFSVFDNSAEYFASTVGFEGMKIPKVSSPSLDVVKKGSELTVIEDFNNQRKFQEHPLIKFFPDVIICVGVPIVLFEKSIGVLALGVCEEILNGEVKFNQLKGIGRVLSELLSAKILSQQAKEELSVQRHTNQIFDSVLKSMSEGVFAVDLTGKVVLYNQSAAELLGVDITNLEPEKWSEFYQCHYSDTNLPVPTEELPIIKAMTKGITSYKEFNIVNRSINRKVTLAVSGNPIMDSLTNVVVGGVAIFSDLTEIKRERNILNQAFNSAVDAIIMINEEKEVDFFNDSAEKIFGFKREEVIGKNVKILIPEPHKSEHDNYVDDNLKSGINKIIGSGRELLMNRKDGTPFWGHMSLGKIDVGNEVLFTAFIKDISEQVEMRNNLKEKHNELMALVESAPVALAMLDNEVKYMAASQKWLEDYGLQGREIIGKCHYDVFPEIGQEWKDIHSYALEGNIVSRDEDSFPRADGSTQWLKWVVRPWTKENGKIGGLIFLTEDISKRREAEIKLREAKETAEKISREKDMFLSNMSHEIRTPLNAINGISQILYSNNPRSDQKEFIDTLKLSSSNLLMIINDVLDYAKLGSGTLQLFKIDFKLFDVIHDIIDINRLVAKEKGIKLEFRYDNRIPAVLSGDNMRLSQVINNLLSNAIKFTNKGHVKVSVEFVSKDEQQVNIKITVEDTGIGIREEDREKIFEQFQQADYSITRQFGGTGLGLSISQSILKMMGSKIEVDSDFGKGSVFSFVISFDYSAKKNIKEEVINFTAFGKINTPLKVLLVEDNRANQLVASAFLKEWGLECDIAENGLEAIEKVKESGENYCVILMDLQMPVMDGYTASRKINDLTKGKIPIISLSASVNALSKEKAIESGILDAVTKPFEPREFYNKLSQYIQVDKFEQKVISSVEKDKLDISFFVNLSDGDEEMKKELLLAVLENIEEIRDEFPGFILNNDKDSASRAIHKIKGIIQKFRKEDIMTLIDDGLKLIDENAPLSQKEKYNDSFVIMCEKLVKGINSNL